MRYNPRRIAVEMPILCGARLHFNDLPDLIGTRATNDLFTLFYAPTSFDNESKIFALVEKCRTLGIQLEVTYA